MGEYWKPINVTKREYIHPHDLDCGLKLREWHYPGTPVMRRVDDLLKSGQWDENDQIYIASDYGGLMQWRGPLEPPAPDDLYSIAYTDYTNVS